MSQKHSIILAAGGTGGHMAPADALAAKLKERGFKVILLTDQRGAEITNMLVRVPRWVLSASGVQGSIIGRAFAGLGLIRSFFEARSILGTERPSLLIGFGGYPSLPAIAAARMLKIPFMVHEQNTVMGRVNRWCAESAATVFTSWQVTMRAPKGAKLVLAGNPVRAEAVAARTQYSAPKSDEKIRISVFGGSLGARILSDVVPAALAGLGNDLSARLIVTHQARPEDVERVRAAYAAAGVHSVVEPYFNNVPALMSDSHLVIARAGASTVAELAAVGRPSILVPLAIAADGHQRVNAQMLSMRGAAVALDETAFRSATTQTLKILLNDREQLTTMAISASKEGERHIGAAEAIVDYIEKFLR